MKLLAAQQVKLGFIGLGNMGSRIALRLLSRGYELTAFDRITPHQQLWQLMVLYPRVTSWNSPTAPT